MTSRNLNQTWRDVVFSQYEADHAADVPFPIRYLIFADQWKRDIFIEVPTKIHPPVYRRAVLDFVKTHRDAEDPKFEGEFIKVRARIRWKDRVEQEGEQAKQAAAEGGTAGLGSDEGKQPVAESGAVGLEGEKPVEG
ncbi:hypothetical protein OQA88_5627 [Cercophora sp. LCS_1]